MNPLFCTSQTPAPPLYEQDELQLITGGTLRPGGIAQTSEILNLCNLAPDSTVLDVGCGPGHTATLLTTEFKLQAIGLDSSSAMLDKARLHAPSVSFIQAEATGIPFENCCFHAVVSECVLSLTCDIQNSLHEMYRVLRPEGSLILSDIYCKQPRTQRKLLDLPQLHSCITHALPLKSIKDGLLQAGFTLHYFQDRTYLLKQLAGQIIFACGSMAKFWRLFMGEEEARQTCCALATVPLGYYMLIAKKGTRHG